VSHRQHRDAIGKLDRYALDGAINACTSLILVQGKRRAVEVLILGLMALDVWPNNT